ncbi:MAG TPA: gamma carbonic anhydrase family protein [Elusimicrobiota bacterium]|jgi:carbonic anhydrase/acetyltransferase-like protein (isoleucine patch superfamily)|nr:gamma carbonic anhydrase family protein [Elusimicrobiota bacterium]
MIRSFDGSRPKLHPTAFVHDSAELIGRVVLAEGASVWPGAVLRGDIEAITIGAGSNVQDLTVMHTRAGHPTVVGKGVTVGHRAILHGCRVGDRTLVGMGAIIMEAEIGPRCLIGAGALITAGMRIPAESLVLGAPAKAVRRLKPAELRMLAASERSYRKLARRHAATERAVFGR